MQIYTADLKYSVTLARVAGPPAPLEGVPGTGRDGVNFSGGYFKLLYGVSGVRPNAGSGATPHRAKNMVHGAAIGIQTAGYGCILQASPISPNTTPAERRRTAVQEYKESARRFSPRSGTGGDGRKYLRDIGGTHSSGVIKHSANANRQRGTSAHGRSLQRQFLGGE